MTTYASTRGSVGSQNFRAVALAGLAPDGGLYQPERCPKITPYQLRELRHRRSYQEIAMFVLSRFMPDIPNGALWQIIQQAYSVEAFGREIVTTKELEENFFLMGLAGGPTLAFKDIGLRFLAHLLEYLLEENGETLNILGATSGDTGSAAEVALRGIKSVKVFMLSPLGRMSPFQRRQMYTISDPAIHNLAIRGTFDDSQAVVKKVMADHEFKEKYRIGAVNSINWARIAAQVVYYVYTYLQVAKPGQSVTFVVPSGNFGNAYSAHIARLMGLPIKTIVVATNENDVLREFLETGRYRPRSSADVKITTSPSMDIAQASNLERLISDVALHDPVIVRVLWDSLGKNGFFDLKDVDLFDPITRVRGFETGTCNDRESLLTIATTLARYGIFVDPHTAVGLKVGRRFLEQGQGPVVVAETAQAAKFEEAIKKATGKAPPIPARFENLAELPEHFTEMDPNPEKVKGFIVEHLA